MTIASDKIRYEHRDDYHGLDCLNIDGSEYLLALNDDQADRAVKYEIIESLWAFNPDFMESYISLDATNLRKLQASLCEDCNDIIYDLLTARNNLETLIDDAIATDGRGHFLNHYDGEERCLDDIVDGTDITRDDIISFIREEINEEIDPNDLLFYQVD